MTQQAERVTLPCPEGDRRRSSPILQGVAFSNIDTIAADRSRSSMISPPPTPRMGRQSHLSLRLRSNSGLALHTNDDVLRQYTDYNPDGSPRTPIFGVTTWSSLESQPGVSYRKSFGQLREPEPTSIMPIPDFFGHEVFQMVLSSPMTSGRLLTFAQTRGFGGDIEFLTKVYEYTRSLNQFVGQISTISTPNNLSSPATKSLNADLKHLNTAVVPGLENIFLESKSCVEQRVARDLYPEFVKHQLALCTGLSLSAGQNHEYPGLGNSFCLTDALKADYPIVSASDGFLSMTGYSRAEVLSRNNRFLQGALTDQGTAYRIQESISRSEDSVELILNYRKDGQPFWNLLYVCPLFDASGKLRYYLGGQINVSETIGSYKDMLRLLTFGSAGEDESDARSMQRNNNRDRTHERKPSVRHRESVHYKSSRSSFFKPFRKQPYEQMSRSEPPSPASSSQGLEQTLKERSTTHSLSVTTQIEAFRTAYSRFIVLEHIPGRSSSRSTASLHSDSTKRKTSPRLNIAFCSSSALEVLGLGMAADAISQRDIFTVLAEQANSPSVTKHFKTCVRERVLRDGKCATLELVLNRGLHRRKGSIITLGRSGDENRKDKLKKSAQPTTVTGSGSPATRMERMSSYWTPLKLEDGAVRWVVLVVSPSV